MAGNRSRDAILSSGVDQRTGRANPNLPSSRFAEPDLCFRNRTGRRRDSESVWQAVRQVMSTVDESRIVAAGIATQRSSVIAWDRRSGKPLSNVISWQDVRGRGFVTSLDRRNADKDSAAFRITCISSLWCIKNSLVTGKLTIIKPNSNSRGRYLHRPTGFVSLIQLD